MVPLYSKNSAVFATVLLAGCEGVQSALDPKGPEAAAIAQATWIMLWAGAAILALVMGLALYAVYRAPQKRPAVSSRTFILAGGVVLPVVALTALLAYGVPLMGKLRAHEEGALAVRVVGSQFRWEFHYPGGISTMNTLRIPAGRPVALSLESRDVIHSLWVPNLAGKLDLVPGRVNRMTIQADRPGAFRGQCAEYCGDLHAHMVLEVIAEPPEAFERWLAGQARR